jgi:hypothetical protein
MHAPDHLPLLDMDMGNQLPCPALCCTGLMSALGPCVHTAAQIICGAYGATH